VPEAPVNENREAILRKHKVGSPGEIRLEAVAKAKRKTGLPKAHLGLRVATPIARHAERALEWREHIGPTLNVINRRYCCQ
jgi:hypothetical protein